MDTILNLGLNDEAVEEIRQEDRQPRFAYDSYRRFIQIIFGRGDGGAEIPSSRKIIDEVRRKKGVHYDTELTVEDLKVLVGRFKAVYKEAMGGGGVPAGAARAADGRGAGGVRSWDNPRAIVYRRMNDIPGTGDRGERAGDGVRKHGRHLRHGVAFTRNPSTGKKASTRNT